MGKRYTGTNDLLFKKVFADQQYNHILIGFIQDVYGLKVENIHIETPYSIDTFYEQTKKKLFFTEVDVVARLIDRTLVTIEMQVQPQDYFAERAVYYLAQKYISNYGRESYFRGREGQADLKYSSLYPVYGLNIVDFTLFEDSHSQDALRHFDLYDVINEEYFHVKTFEERSNKNDQEKKLIKLSFLELPRSPAKHQKHLKDWIDFFTKGTVSQMAPSYIQEACQIINDQNLKKEERTLIDIIEKARKDHKAKISYHENKERFEGKIEGIKEGKLEGIKVGRLEGKLEIAQNLLQEGFPVQVIVRATGLQEKEILALKDLVH